MNTSSIQYVKGVGPRLAELFKKKDIYTVEDALYFLPRTYEDRKNFIPIKNLIVGPQQTSVGLIRRVAQVPLQSGRGKIFEITVTDPTGFIRLKWFHFNLKYMLTRYKIGQKVVFTGDVKIFRYQKEMTHPDIEIIEDDKDSLHFGRIVPVYSETEGLYQKTIRRILSQILNTSLDKISDPLPQDIIQRQKLLDLKSSFQHSHFPDELGMIDPARKRLVFDEFFFLSLSLALKRRQVNEEIATGYELSRNLKPRLMSLLPFALTPSQQNAILDIEKDLQKSHPMNRLLQGDVGSGKTVVSLIGSLPILEQNHQVALMAPTEILAEQHLATLSPYLEKLGIQATLLTSDVNKKDREERVKLIQENKIRFIIGTHALIQSDVLFSKLGMIIIDEQHRFGVEQRLLLKKKGQNPHMLVMTATPIPRSLSLTVYGDLDLSIMPDLPPGRKPVKTKVIFEHQRFKLYEFMKKEIAKGRQAYVVYPLIEESEKVDLKNATEMAEELKKYFTEFKVTLLHGRMSSEDKKKIMSDFKNKTTHILVSTTVIEVGIDVPNSTLMIVEHAERFGLSQLHQLRGRIGRGQHESYCFLMTHVSHNPDSQTRLKAMEQHSSGFKIAEVDLELRGPGEFLGARQSGLAGFRVANLVTDQAILIEARKEAFNLIDRDPFLSSPEHAVLKDALEKRWNQKISLVHAG